MLLLRSSSPRAEADVWTAHTGIRAGAREVLDALTDPAAIADWAPVPFQVEGLAGGRLQAGSYELVSYFAACCLSFSLPHLQASNGHVIVDLVVRHASARTKWALGIGALLLATLFFSLLTWRLSVNAQLIFVSKQISDILGIPLWTVYVVTALGPAMTVPVCIDQLLQLIRRGPVHDAG